MPIDREAIVVQRWANVLAANLVCGLVQNCGVTWTVSYAMDNFSPIIAVHLARLLDELENGMVSNTTKQLKAGI